MFSTSATKKNVGMCRRRSNSIDDCHREKKHEIRRNKCTNRYVSLKREKDCKIQHCAKKFEIQKSNLYPIRRQIPAIKKRAWILRERREGGMIWDIVDRRWCSWWEKIQRTKTKQKKRWRAKAEREKEGREKKGGRRCWPDQSVNSFLNCCCWKCEKVILFYIE